MDRQIEVAGAEPEQRPRTSGETGGFEWRLLLVGVGGIALGAAITFMLTTTSAAPPATIAGTQETLPPPPDVTSATTPGHTEPAREPTLQELVPGLDSDLVGFGFSPTGRSVVQRWALDTSEPEIIDVPFGLAIADLSQTWIAALVSQRYGDSNNLHVGNATYREVIATDVGSAVWSVDQPSRIAWTERTGDGTIARDQTLGGDAATQISLAVHGDARVVWLDGDRLTIETSTEIASFAPDGTETGRLDAATFVAGTDGWALVWLDGELMLIDGTLTPLVPVPVDGGLCGTARFAPLQPASSSTMRRLAVLCGVSDPPTVEIFDIDPIAPTFFHITSLELTEAGTGQISWLDGDRFVAVPQPDPQSRPRSTITILDTLTGTITWLEWPGAVFGVVGTR